MSKISNPSPNRPIVNDKGHQLQEMRTWMKAITEQSLVTGEGSPEGVLEAIQGSRYMDTTGATGSLIYYKRDSHINNDARFGWILV